MFARGIRQPWQMAFYRDSPSPFVSDLGLDAANDPPDYVLRVSAGQNYGFPTCTVCANAPSPFKVFAPHTDIMGMAIVGNRLYMTSFMGPGAAGPGGEVLVMSLKTKTVGLGVNGHSLYIGELTGQAFRVTAP